MVKPNLAKPNSEVIKAFDDLLCRMLATQPQPKVKKLAPKSVKPKSKKINK